MSHGPGCILESVFVPGETQRGFVKSLCSVGLIYCYLLVSDPNLSPTFVVVHLEALTVTT